MQEKSHYQSWLHFAKVWDNLIVPPSRPCPSQLKIYNDIFKKKVIKSKRPIVLILGATPELRDLCLDNGFKVTVCDLNPAMVKGMTSLMKPRASKSEKIIITDWLKMDFPADSFDIIMGDASLNQILQAKKLKILLAKLKKFLKPSGLLIIREVVRSGPKPLVTENKWRELYEEYQKKKITLFDIYNFYKYQSDANSYRRSPSLIDWPPVFKKLEKLTKERRIEKDFLNLMERTFGKKSKQLLVFIKKDLDKLLAEYFILLPIRQCHDYRHCCYMPLILAKPKK